MPNKFIRGVVIAFIAIGALFIMMGPLGLNPRKAKFFAVVLCATLWYSGFLKSNSRFYHNKNEKVIQNSKRTSIKVQICHPMLMTISSKQMQNAKVPKKRSLLRKSITQQPTKNAVISKSESVLFFS